MFEGNKVHVHRQAIGNSYILIRKRDMFCLESRKKVSVGYGNNCHRLKSTDNS